MSSSSQFVLEFEHRPSLSGDDFLIAANNADAVAWVDRWPHWESPFLAIYGPAGCGKTHLAAVFEAMSGATRITDADFRAGILPEPLPGSAYILEDGDRFLDEKTQQPLFHFYNSVRESKSHLLFTGRAPVARWETSLKDLSSRLRSVQAVEIGPPGDDLIAALLVKLFADRQLRVDEGVINFMLMRMERSFDNARTLVEAIDKASLAEGRKITVPFIRNFFD